MKGEEWRTVGGWDEGTEGAGEGEGEHDDKGSQERSKKSRGIISRDYQQVLLSI